ncbi:N-alpha-acetyltransferase 38, NatC auxiliary subunit isoform X2 [Narcine bancroftii]|uniref:N-alpha-acetyltransferase 38, NatC auxiliary subunit isoform X2 n=1 Tax=Narcine bancroftii TaxID=1343680 RepID=UPI00383145DF
MAAMPGMEVVSVLGENGQLSEEQRNGPAGHGMQVRDGLYSHARCMLESLLNRSMRIRMTDGRTLVGLFLCTDRDCNVILGSAQEYLKPTGRGAGAGFTLRVPGNVHPGPQSRPSPGCWASP